MKVSIQISELPNLAGRNPFVNHDEACERIVKRHSLQGFRKLVRDRGTVPDWLKTRPLDSLTYDHYRSEVKDARSCATGELEGVKCAEAQKTLLEMLGAPRREQKTISLFEEFTNLTVSNKSTAYEMPLWIQGGKQFMLSGVIDGIVDELEAVLEIKERANGFLERPRPSEEIQCQGYMQITGLRRAYLAQHHDSILKHSLVIRDDEWFDIIVADLHDNLTGYINYF